MFIRWLYGIGILLLCSAVLFVFTPTRHAPATAPLKAEDPVAWHCDDPGIAPLVQAAQKAFFGTHPGRSIGTDPTVYYEGSEKDDATEFLVPAVKTGGPQNQFVVTYYPFDPMAMDSCVFTVEPLLPVDRETVRMVYGGHEAPANGCFCAHLPPALKFNQLTHKNEAVIDYDRQRQVQGR